MQQVVSKIHVPDSIRNQERSSSSSSSQLLAPGALTSILSSARNDRLSLSKNNARSSRFAGVYRVNTAGAVPATNVANPAVADGGSNINNLSAGTTSKLVRENPLANHNPLPQMKSRHVKKNLTFAAVCLCFDIILYFYFFIICFSPCDFLFF